MAAKTVHAYRRKQPFEVELFGVLCEFKLNDSAEVVCEVPAGAALDRLLAIGEAYTVLGQPPGPAFGASMTALTVTIDSGESEDDADASPFVITQGDDDEAVDLRKLTKAELVKFAAENELDLDNRLGAEKYRQAIVDALTVE